MCSQCTTTYFVCAASIFNGDTVTDNGLGHRGEEWSKLLQDPWTSLHLDNGDYAVVLNSEMSLRGLMFLNGSVEEHSSAIVESELAVRSARLYGCRTFTFTVIYSHHTVAGMKHRCSLGHCAFVLNSLVDH